MEYKIESNFDIESNKLVKEYVEEVLADIKKGMPIKSIKNVLVFVKKENNEFLVFENVVFHKKSCFCDKGLPLEDEVFESLKKNNYIMLSVEKV